MSKGKIVGIDINGIVETHMSSPTGNYATLCGLDGDDPDLTVNQRTVFVDTKMITCATCKMIWDICSKFSVDDFTAEGERSK